MASYPLRILARWSLSCAAVLVAIPLALSAQNLPTPESVLGHMVGEDFYLATYEESLDYLQQLAAASDRVELREIGRTSNGTRASRGSLSAGGPSWGDARDRGRWRSP